MSAGRKDQLVTFERATVAADAYGEEIETWGTHAEAWAAVYYGKGDERRQAAAEQGRQAATFEVLANPETLAVTLRDRIAHGGTWDIVGISPKGRGEIAFDAVRAL